MYDYMQRNQIANNYFNTINYYINLIFKHINKYLKVQF